MILSCSLFSFSSNLSVCLSICHSFSLSPIRILFPFLSVSARFVFFSSRFTASHLVVTIVCMILPSILPCPDLIYDTIVYSIIVIDYRLQQTVIPCSSFFAIVYSTYTCVLYPILYLSSIKDPFNDGKEPRV